MKGRAGLFLVLAAVLSVSVFLSASAFASPPITFGVSGDKVKVSDEWSTWAPGWRNIASRGSKVYAVTGYLTFTMSRDGGTFWGRSVDLSGIDPLGNPWGKSIAVSADPSNPENTIVHLGYYISGAVRYTRCVEGPVDCSSPSNWSTPVSVNGAYQVQDSGSVAADDSGNVYVSWFTPTSSEVYVSASTDGVNWSQTKASDTLDSQYPAAVAGPGGKVHVAWWNGVGGDVLYRRGAYNGYGISWDTAEQDLDGGGYVSWTPSIAVSGQMVCVIWDGWDDVHWGEPTNCSSSGGDPNTWNGPVYVDLDCAEGDWYSIAVSPLGDVFASWGQQGGCETLVNGNVYFSRSRDGGGSWEAPVLIDSGDFPSLASDPEGKALLLFTSGPVYGPASFKKQK